MITFLGLKISKWILLLLLGDIAAFCLAIPLGLLFITREHVDYWFFLDQYKIPLVLLTLTYVLVLYIANLYDHYLDFRRRENISRVILTCLIGTLVAELLFCFPSWRIIPRKFVEWHAVAFVWLTTLWRYSFSFVALPLRLQRHVLILGAGRAGRWIARVISQQPNCGLAVKGFIDDDPNKMGATIDGFEVIGQSGMLSELVNQEKVSLLVLAITHEKSGALLLSLNQIVMNGVELIDVANLNEFLTGKIPVDHISAIWIYFNNLSYRKSYYTKIKWMMDLTLSCLGLFITWPIFIIIALAIRLETPGPVLFKQQRLGYNNKYFKIIKFRTMIADTNEDTPKWTSLNDSRITRVGYLLRRMHLDELPQLINILKGEMSLIGPRAEWDIYAHKSQELVPEWRPGRRATDPLGYKVFIQYRETIPFYSYRLLVRPGVTGWAQVMFPRAGSSVEDLKEKLEYDLYYIKNMSVLLDLAILMKTIRIVLFGHGK
jgi:lipopolysaccharide/colanic/teichoic acid biosynthesis glycosyltransferase